MVSAFFFFQKLVAFSETARAPPPPCSVLSQLNPVHISRPWNLNSVLILSSHVYSRILSVYVCVHFADCSTACASGTTELRNCLFVASIVYHQCVTSNFIVDLNRKKRFLNSRFSRGTFYRVKAVAYRGGGLGVQTIPPKFRRPSKIVPNPTRLRKLKNCWILDASASRCTGKKSVKF